MNMRKVPVCLLHFAIVLILVGCQPVESQAPSATPSGTATVATDEDIYTDPQTLFTVPIPTNWSTEQAEGYGILSSPNDGINVYVLTLDASDLEEAIQQAWQTVDPTFDLEPDQILDEPASNVERAVTVTYSPEDENQFALAGGRLHDGIAYITLVRGDLVSVQQRTSQLQIVLSGFDILAVEEVNLAGVEPQPITPDVLNALEAYIEDAMARFNIPGTAVAIVQGDEIVYTGGFGIRDPDSGDPVTPQTRMMIGSTSKTMTTMLMAMLVDDGVFDWETPVVEIVPTFAVADPTLTQQITVENLVCACTGVPRRDLEIIFNYDILSAEGVVESLATFQFFTDFGEAFQYSNQMVATGGYVAAAAAGGDYGNLYEAYETLMQERIFSPIGMSRTILDFETVLSGSNYAVPHELTIDGDYSPAPLDWERFVTPLAPAGAYWSTAEDMGRYLITELKRGETPTGERIVSTENLTHTWEPQIPVAADTSYGLGWMIGDYKGQRVIAHGGNTIGFTSELAFLPEVGIGISVVTNAWATNPFNEAVRTRLLEMLFLQEFEADEAAAFQFEALRSGLTDLATTVGTEVDPESVTPFEGRYQNEVLGVVDLALEERRLLMDIGEFVAEIRPTMNDEGEGDGYIFYDSPLRGTPVDLRQEAEGGPTLVVGEGVVEYRFERINTP